jgi:Gpi18-like mannosyltransferase
MMPDRRPTWLPWLLIGLAAARIALGVLPGFPPDLYTYKLWALVAGVRGVHTVYDAPAPAGAGPTTIDSVEARYDYPPLYAYLLAPAGRIAAWIDPEVGLHLESSRLFTMLVKIPPLLFDVLTALLLAWIVTRLRLWGDRPTWVGWAPALVYLFHPGVLFDSAYWGQPDAVHVFFILLSLTLVLRGRPHLGVAAAALACLMKPLAAPFVPWIALAILARCGWRRLLTGGAVGLMTGLVVLAPFLLTGRAGLLLRRLVGDVDLMPYTSINAHNLWWLLAPWRDVHRPLAGPITPTMVGLILFGAVFALMAVRAWKMEKARPAEADDIWYLGAAGVAFSFFYMMTHMHENHLFALIPLSILLIGGGRSWVWFAVGVAVVTFVNMATHDWAIDRALLWGGGGLSGVIRPDTGRAIALREFVVATGNAVLVTALYVFYVVGGIRRASLKRLK